MAQIAKWLVGIGIGIALIGILIWLGTKMSIPLGKLPGDIHVQKEKFSFFFPIATSLLISLFLTILLNLLLWWFRR